MYKGRPIIALMPLYDEKKDSYWMLPGYMKALEEQGAIPLMPPLNADRTQLDFFWRNATASSSPAVKTFRPGSTARNPPPAAASRCLSGTTWMPMC